MKVEIDTNEVPVGQLVKIAEALAAEAVRKVGDILFQLAGHVGEAPLTMAIFAGALIDANNGCGPLEIDDQAEWKKAITALEYLNKEFRG